MELQLRLPGDGPVGQHRHAPPAPAGGALGTSLNWTQTVLRKHGEGWPGQSCCRAMAARGSSLSIRASKSAWGMAAKRLARAAPAI